MKKLTVILFSLLMLASCSPDEASIGIIGGADGPTAIVTASKTDELDEMPQIDGVPTPPGDFASASQNGATVVIGTGNVTAVMYSEYVGCLENAGFDVGDTTSDEMTSAMTIENESYVVSLILNDTALTTIVTEK